MIRIQKLKEPKKTSGRKIVSGATHKIQGIMIENQNKFPVYVDAYERKRSKTKVEKKD